MLKHAAFSLVLSLFAFLPTTSAQTTNKKQVTNASDLPRFVYPVKGSASELVQSDAATFNAFASKVQSDLDSIFRDYEIQDKASLRELLGAKLNLQELAGDYKAALETTKQIRSLEEKPAAKLTAALADEDWLEAAIESGNTNSSEFRQSFSKHYRQDLGSLPWDTVQDDMREKLRSSELDTKASALGWIQTEYDPAVRTSGALDNHQAWDLIGTRQFLVFYDSVKAEWRAEIKAYVAAHNQLKPDIWQARDVTLSSDQKLTPVTVAIWDSGIDESIFGNRAFTDPHPTASGNHGLAFDDKGGVSTSWVYPLTVAQQNAYPTTLADMKGFVDLQDVVNSPEAISLQKKIDSFSADQMHEFFENLKLFGFYVHGTHVAGIVARGNPAVRLAVARFDDQLPDLPFPPTPEWAHALASDFMQMSDYFRTRTVRVVNMSWGDDPGEFETWLSKTGGGADPAERKQRAAELYKIWYDGVANAIKGAPDTLFVVAAGNADSDASFLQDVPAGLQLPNVIVVGAVNQAGEETSFTSYGPTVVVDADGYEVESYVPGGTRLKLSGTSMASPNVANLAAKLLALDPSLTPPQVIDLIRKGATASQDGRRHLINPKRSVELLRTARNASAVQ
ncbi:MAG TPA: S8 family serine peptidase [Terriglobales bacterium]|nr:S8 family serine peptidase [Terriglobales bacterium]